MSAVPIGALVPSIMARVRIAMAVRQAEEARAPAKPEPVKEAAE